MKYQTEGERAIKLADYKATSADGPIRAAVSSDAPVTRSTPLGKYNEILRHSPEALDLQALNSNGLPLTINHSERDPLSDHLPIGMVRNFELNNDGKMRGDLFFDTDDRGMAARGKVERGFAPNVSITYRVDPESAQADGDDVTFSRWTPLAVSLVTLPADAHTGVGRSLDVPPTEVHPVTDDVKRDPEAAPAATPADEARIRSSTAYQRGAEAERSRLNEINQTATQLSRSLPQIALDIEELATQARDDGRGSEQFRTDVLALIGGEAQPLSLEAPADDYGPSIQAPGARHRNFVPGEDQRKKVAKGIELALYERMGGTPDADDMKGNQFRGYSVSDAQRELLRAHNVDCRGWTPEQVARYSIGMDQDGFGSRAIDGVAAQYTVASFAEVTSNVFTKRVFDGFAEAPRVWDIFCDTGEVPDFRTFDVPRLSHVSALPSVAENAQYTNLTRVDEKETATLVKYGGLMSFTMELMLADDMNMLGRNAEAMGRASQRTVDEQFISILTTNGNMGDGNPLFDSVNHSNDAVYVNFDLPLVTAVRTEMARQTDDNSIVLDIPLSFILTAPEERDTAENLANSEWLVDSGGSAQRVNTVRGAFVPVSTARLTDVNDLFFFGPKGQTITAYFLVGNRSPFLDREENWSRDAIHMKVRMPVVFVPNDWRAMSRRTKV